MRELASNFSQSQSPSQATFPVEESIEYLENLFKFISKALMNLVFSPHKSFRFETIDLLDLKDKKALALMTVCATVICYGA